MTVTRVTEPSAEPSRMARRAFLQAAAVVAAAGPIMTEATLAQAKMASQRFGVLPPDAVIINANENPLGPCQAACEAITKILPLGGRYDRMGELDALTNEYAALHGLKPENIAFYAGSSEPLHYTTLAFTSPTRSLVMADPSYESAAAAAKISQAKVHRVPLSASYAHDVEKMVAADPQAGLIYIVNPNNPTGTITPREQILWALDHKPAGSVLLVDEAYIHLSEEKDVLDQVAAGKDLIVLRTFSKIYGMAGIRCGVAIGRPDLLEKLQPYYQNAMPVTALAAARASLADKELIPTRRKWIADTRTETIGWLKTNGYKPIGDSRSNCFMIDTGRPGGSVVSAMRKEQVYIGRLWPVWPNAVRISVGTPEDMAKFRTVFKKVMDAPAVAAAVGPAPAIPGRGGKTFLS
ncbi:MAG: aminotransferase class [Phenylobacterium sp.]|nr:aminotransferase class [Phenylobacterium sp.]